MTENQNLFTIDDIWAEKDKNQPIDPTKIYDPQHFWDGYGQKFFAAHDKRETFQFGLQGNNPVAWLIFKLGLLKCDTVLEPGCGFGRLAPFVIDGNGAKEYTGCDFSEKILECHKEYLLKPGNEYAHIDHVHFAKASAKRMPYSNNSMDCVISSELLMHMTRTKAEHCLREFVRIARKNIILVERYVFSEEHPYPHMWSHDYQHMVSNMGLTVLESKVIGAGMLGLICKV